MVEVASNRSPVWCLFFSSFTLISTVSSSPASQPRYLLRARNLFS